MMARFLAAIPISRPIFIALILGGLAGMLFMVFLLEFDHYSSTNKFCTSCHSMTYVEEEYQKSVHYNPVSGVRAECGDCHVSAGVFAATWDHIKGGKDLWKQLFGANYDDPVVNALHLPEAAFATRQWFRETGSATCQRCHVLGAIQGKRADTAAIHREETQGKSCIDCHENLVHRPVPSQETFKRAAWNQMIEEEFGLTPGTAERMLAD